MVLLFKNLLFSAIVPGTFGFYLPWWISRGRPMARGAWMGASILFFAIGLAIYLWCLWDFASIGRGTPLPLDAPRRLVVRGLYRHTRNPMYLGVLSILLGWLLLFPSWRMVIYASVLGTVFHLFVVLYEEPHLENLFGEEYARYRARVGRWLPWVG